MIEMLINHKSDDEVYYFLQPVNDLSAVLASLAWAQQELKSSTRTRCSLRVHRKVFSSAAKSVASFARIEFAAFIMTLSYGLHSVIRTNLLIEKTCRVDLNFGDAICDDIDNQTNQQEQDMVQERVNDINLYFTFISSVPW